MHASHAPAPGQSIGPIRSCINTTKLGDGLFTVKLGRSDPHPALAVLALVQGSVGLGEVDQAPVGRNKSDRIEVERA